MAYFTGPNIVINGLTLYADPANLKSNEGGVNMVDMTSTYNQNKSNGSQMSISGDPKVITSNGNGGCFRYLIAAGNSVDWATAEWSISAWGIRDNSIATENRMWDLSEAGNGHLRLTLAAVPNLNFRPAGASSTELISGGSSVVGKWYNVVITKSGTTSGGSATYTMYNNGVQVASNTTSALTTESAFSYITIMRSSDDDNANISWDGDFGPFSVYDRILSTTEVAQNFNGLKSRFGL